MRARQFIARTYLRFSRWTFVHEPLPERAMVIGAPHTSNWDGVFMALCFWSLGRPFHFLVKDSIIRKPLFGPWVRWIGGIGVDRSAGSGLVDRIVQLSREESPFTVVLTPKGTRSARPYWKSGFHRIATGADLPVFLGFVDRSTMTFGWGHSIRPGQDLRADMDRIRAFYATKSGFHPEKASVPRLRAEDEDAGGVGDAGAR
ncbi:1-acyl-sn-glycerol-3-phosphate acyltransferase [Schaalia sp. 19OD2882]|uniref:1-acyl-sn-glycerol-3-phosphate acyltransferase n=1 Tax=Schaalia sp. 19OD2882 TaxID=2794089 RepID=UPI001C1EEB98|nr:1-acyl-sn-glycerol-3-phosphate acyltransferase [Schaalia sp. 19OD2882]QWW20237.1 1-acyl-sn-glycerol-3-phosphate acyltransferase [Schaalia sp. 19OD2882]